MTPNPGAIRYTDPNGVVHEANPGDRLFSTVLMLASEYWDGKQWAPIEDGMVSSMLDQDSST